MNMAEADEIVGATISQLLEKQDHVSVVKMHISVNVLFKNNRK